MMGGFIDLATFDDLLKIEDVLDTRDETVEVLDTRDETVAEIIVAAEPIIMTVIEPMIEAELKMLVAPILEPVISLAEWEAEQQIKATLQALIEKSRKKAIKKKG